MKRACLLPALIPTGAVLVPLVSALTLAVATLSADVAVGATLYVDAAAPAEGASGTATSPFPTIVQAVDVADAGDVVSVEAGVYAESVVVDVAISIQGAEGLRTVVTPAAPWSLEAPGATIEGLRFEGSGDWSVAVDASQPFTIEDCQFQDFGVALWIDGVATNGVVRHNRILGNTYGIILRGSGHATYVLVENNQIVAPGATGGIYAFDTRWRGLHNQISGPSWGIYHQLPSRRNLPISYLRNNLVTEAVIGIMGSGLDPHELKVEGNSVDAAQDTAGLIASDVLLTVHDDCGASAGTINPIDHGFGVSGACVDGGLWGTDPDGTPADIGPHGGSQGGDWWQTLGCAGPHVSCPAEDLEAWLGARPEVRSALWWYEAPAGFEAFDSWSDDLRFDLFDSYTAAWYDYAPTLPEPMPNAFEVGPNTGVVTVHEIDDATDLFFSLVIESFLTEMLVRVPWTIDDLGGAGRTALFDGRELYKVCTGITTIFCPPGGTTLTFVDSAATPANGSYTWDFVSEQLGIDATREQLIGEAIDWSRDNMLHSTSTGFTSLYEQAMWHWNFAGAPPVSRVIEGFDAGPLPGTTIDPPLRHNTKGCHGTNQWLREVLRVANVPVVYVQPHHATPWFPSEDAYLTHGDDPYNLYSKTADYPASDLLIDGATYAEWFTNAPNDGWDNVGRRVTELAAIWLPTPFLEVRCDDIAAGNSKVDGDVFAYLDQHYTQADLAAMNFWVDIDAKIVAEGTCTVPLPLGSS